MNIGLARDNRIVSGPNIGRALIILFLVKPFADLFWASRVIVAGIKVAPAHVVGLIALIYFALILIRYPRERPYCATLLKIFIIINLLSVMMGLVGIAAAAILVFGKPSEEEQ